MNAKWVAVFAALLLGGLMLNLSGTDPSASGIRIGASEGLGGLLVDYTLREKGIAGTILPQQTELLSFKDCCTATTQWALSSERIDAAVMCPDAARTLVEKDDRYEIMGPCLVNSDILVLREPEPKKIGVGTGRTYQVRIVESHFGGSVESKAMVYSALPYAMEKKDVDGIVIDVLKGWSLTGARLPGPGNGEDIVSEVLVVRKSFRQDPRFAPFAAKLAEAAVELNRPETLGKELRRYKGLEWKEEDWETWTRLRIRFLSAMPGTGG